MEKFLKKSIVTVFCLIILLNMGGCGKKLSPVSKNTFLLDTSVTITLYEYEGNEDEIIEGAFELCRKYESLLSRTVEGSDIYKINHSGGKGVKVNGETALLIEKALYYCKLSGGKFDITILPLSELWNFKSDAPTVPDSDKLIDGAKYVDYTKITLDGDTVYAPEGVKIDLGAIAKGYIADKTAQYLKEHGVKSAIIDLGGNIFALGDKQGEDFKIGIRSPFDGQKQVGYVKVKDKTVVTSGVYERCFEKDGKRYHHILDTKTGMPVENGVESVTVICDNSADADALSTLCFVLGKERGTELLNSLDGVYGVYVMADGGIFPTKDAPFTTLE